MSRTSKSPRTVRLIAMDVAKRALPEYAHRCSPKKFTQHQLFACLVLKSFCRTDYRGVVAMLREWSDLRAVIGLDDVPHFTTLQKTTARLLLRRKANRLLEVTLACADEHSPQRTLTKLAAIDGSGFEAHHISRYFVRRRQRGFTTRGIWQTTTYRRYPKIGLVCDCATHLVIAAQPGRGPGADITHLDRVMVDALSRRRIHTLLADAGYDAEWAHEFLRNDLGIRHYRREACRASDQPDLAACTRAYRGYLSACIAIVGAFINRYIRRAKFDGFESEAFSELQEATSMQKKIELWHACFTTVPDPSFFVGHEWSEFFHLRDRRNRLVHAADPVFLYSVREIKRDLNSVRIAIGGMLSRMRRCRDEPIAGFVQRLQSAPRVFWRKVTFKATGEHDIKEVQ